MAKPTGFLEFGRETPERRPVAERVHDWLEVYESFPTAALQQQAARCMDCGIPFCHQGCPLGNIIPDWNDLVYRDRWQEAIERLHATNNFPEFTGRLCPAPCEASCVLGINQDPVTIKQVELTIIEHAFREGWITPEPAAVKTGKRVAVIGSGPAGLAAAQQLARAGHDVTVFERDDRIGGLMRYGIPDFKMQKEFLDRRIAQMEAEGVVFKPSSNVGVDIDANELRAQFDAVLLSGGASQARDLTVPGRELNGVHFAMEYLPQQNRRNAGDEVPSTFISAEGKRVIILGGGDTGADCLGTAIRQGATEVLQYELLPRPADSRPAENPWPTWPNIYRVSSAHEEGGMRDYSILTKSLSGDAQGNLQQLHAVRIEFVTEEGRQVMREVAGSEFTVDVDLLFLAMGFVGPERGGLLSQLGVELTERGNVKADASRATSVPGVFAAGDMARGQSLIVWAIAEGRTAARGIDEYLMGESALPSPL